MTTPSLIELLENRIAPATFVNPYVVTYTDVDGDLVKVKSSKPIFHEDLREFTFLAEGEGESLKELLLKGSAYGADIKVKIIESSTSGDGAVDVGFINANGVDLHSVTIQGALDRIWVGDSDPQVRGIGLLHVGSLGIQLPGDYRWNSNLILGAGIVRIDGDLSGRLEAADSADTRYMNLAKIDRLFVGGNLTGSLHVDGGVGKIKVAGDVIGGDYEYSGSITAKSIGKLVIEGSVLGGVWEHSGTVETKKGIGTVVVKGDIAGGDGLNSGGISYGGTQNASFWLGGSLMGGSGQSSGFVSPKQVDLLRINGDIVGGSGHYSGRIDEYRIYEKGPLGVIRIDGNVQGGDGVLSGQIKAEVQTSLLIKGSILGSDGALSGSVSISPVANTGTAYGIRIGGDIVGGPGHSSGKLLAWDPDESQNGPAVTVNITVDGGLFRTLESSDPIWGATAGSIEGAKLGKVKIGGPIVAAENTRSETPITSYAIRASDSITKLKIGGNIEGTATNSLAIFAGSPLAGNNTDDRIGQLIVGGDVSFATVTAGYGQLRPGYEVFNPDAGIGQVRIDGDLIASSITAGIHPGPDGRFGTEDDLSEAEDGDVTELRSRIASIIVRGQLKGTEVDGDAFGIAAQQVKSVIIGGVPVSLTAELDTIQLAPNTGDVLLREHA